VIQSAAWSPVSSYTPVDPTHHYEKEPEPIELPVEIVRNILETFKSTKVGAFLESLTVYEHVVTNLGTDVYCGSSKLFARIFITPVPGITIVYSFGFPGENVIKHLEQLEELDLRRFSQWDTITSGQYDVVLSPQVTGMLFHEISHSFEGSCPEMPGFPSHISVLDHPEAERLGGYHYDSEGCKASQTVLVDKGVVQGCLASVFEPGSTPPTGNGRAAFNVQPLPRQSNLEVNIHTKQCTEEELLKMVKDGIYIAQVGRGSAFSGGITYFSNTVSYRIKKGECSALLKNVSFGGNLLDMVKSIQFMGCNEKVEPAVCWKNHQRLFVTTKAPSSLIRGMPLLCYTSSRSSKQTMEQTNSSTSL
jgi:predicted Zn-dependent protease